MKNTGRKKGKELRKSFRKRASLKKPEVKCGRGGRGNEKNFEEKLKKLWENLRARGYGFTNGMRTGRSEGELGVRSIINMIGR